ncbi:MAG: geranylgeranylglyceryl/heptaprenylglyceryl phosphate synthase [Bacteroidota bacterium]
MLPSGILEQILLARKQSQKLFSVLIDPDKTSVADLPNYLELAQQTQIDFFFIGGSLLVEDRMKPIIQALQMASDIPTIIFPGSPLQICKEADAILLLALLSGRNPELLIGQHVIAAPYLKASQLEVISTAYLLIDGGVPTTASYMSNSTPIPNDKPDIAACTALAAEMLGFKLIYLDAGSGAQKAVPQQMIKEVRNQVDLPMIVGGGIKSPKMAQAALTAGADMIVIGNAIEKDPKLILEIGKVIR